MFTLRAKTRGARYWQIDASKFLMYMKCHGNGRIFKQWQKQQDLFLANSLAKNLHISVRALY